MTAPTGPAIRKAVFHVAGPGKRFRPATKATASLLEGLMADLPLRDLRPEGHFIGHLLRRAERDPREGRHAERNMARGEAVCKMSMGRFDEVGGAPEGVCFPVPFEPGGTVTEVVVIVT